jgi:serine/threonine protein kinase
MDTPQRADTRPAHDAAKLPKGWTEHSLGELPRPALTGAMLDDRFEVKGRLGEGGMADLYLGADRHLRCRVAIKILRDDSPDSRARFLREAEVLSNVHHENLVDVVARGAVQPGGMPYTVLRFLPGEDLKTRLVEGGPLAWATVVEIGIQVADALACLHEAGVLHRDVKPENIMWTHHTSRRVFVKLIDLGAARTSLRFQGRQDRSFTPVCGPRGTAVGSVVGTREYMPPEAGLQEPDARTDVFALGVTLYQLCTGKLPDDPLTPTPIRTVNPDAQVPEDVERVIMAALQWNTDARTPTAAKLRRELSALRAVHATAVDEGGLFAGRIELREHLATGAEAEVFRAYHCKLRRPVALKRPLERLEGNPDDRARFEREAWVLAALDHPGLPDVLDSGTVDGRPYTVMELCAGRPAQRYCEEDTRLRLAEVLQVGIQVAEALRSVHAIGVIHRDLSAQNVLIEAGREPRVKVIDFTGCLLTDRFFNLRDEPRPADPLTILRDRPLHTLSFAAPEVRADRCWSERSDVYALGVLLYRLLSGKVPFAPQARDQYIPLPAGLHGRSVEDVLMAMLNPNPAERLADMAMVAERLREVLEMEAERNPAPPRPPLALVPSEPDHETAVEASPGEAVAGPSGEPIAVDPVAIVADVQTPVSEADAETAVGLVAAAAANTSRATPPATPSRGLRRALGAGLALALLGGMWMASTPTVPLTFQPAPDDAPAPTPTAPARAIVAPELTPPQRAPGARENLAPTPDTPRPRLRQAAVQRLLATGMKACRTAEWLALKLRVADGVGHVETINGFAPDAPDPGGVGQCVAAAVGAAKFPTASPATFTLTFEPDR